MAESFLYHLVNHPNSDLGDLTILDMVLECVGNHDYEVRALLVVIHSKGLQLYLLWLYLENICSVPYQQESINPTFGRC